MRLHVDEFLEAFAHSHLGRWGVEWHGFRCSLPLLTPRAADDPTAVAGAPFTPGGASFTAGSPTTVEPPLLAHVHSAAGTVAAAEWTSERAYAAHGVAHGGAAHATPGHATPGVARSYSAPGAPSVGTAALKQMVFQRVHTAYKEPRALCLRISSRPVSHAIASAQPNRARVDILAAGPIDGAVPLAVSAGW